jgi:hypothetical protein
MDYFHLSSVPLSAGSIINAGNWGRIIMAASWQHNYALREMALEQSRIGRFSHLPSRLNCSFVFLSRDEALRFKQQIPGFSFHILYRVSLTETDANSHVTDWRLNIPIGNLRADWPDVYWMGLHAFSTTIPGVDWNNGQWAIQSREMLTLSDLRIEETLN